MPEPQTTTLPQNTHRQPTPIPTQLAPTDNPPNPSPHCHTTPTTALTTKLIMLKSQNQVPSIPAPTTAPTTALSLHTPYPTTLPSTNANHPRQYIGTTAFRYEQIRRISAPRQNYSQDGFLNRHLRGFWKLESAKLLTRRRVEPYPCAIHQHHRHRKRCVPSLSGVALRRQSTRQRLPTLVRDCLQAIQQRAQSWHKLINKGFGGKAKEQVAV